MKLNPLKKFLKLSLRQNSFIALSFLLAFNSWAQIKPMNVFINSKTKVVSFSLPSNPTTGFRWQLLKYDNKTLKFIDRNYLAAKPRLIGSGGKDVFQFEVLKKPLNTIVELKYARPWEKKQGLLQHVRIISKD